MTLLSENVCDLQPMIKMSMLVVMPRFSFMEYIDDNVDVENIPKN